MAKTSGQYLVGKQKARDAARKKWEKRRKKLDQESKELDKKLNIHKEIMRRTRKSSERILRQQLRDIKIESHTRRITRHKKQDRRKSTK